MRHFNFLLKRLHGTQAGSESASIRSSVFRRQMNAYQVVDLVGSIMHFGWRANLDWRHWCRHHKAPTDAETVLFGGEEFLSQH